MFSYVVLFAVFVGKTLTQYNLPESSKCTGVVYNGQILKKTVLYSSPPRIIDMVYSMREDTIYFIYEAGDTRLLGIMHVPDRNYTTNLDIHNPRSIAINQWHNRVYVGTSDGIYLVNGRNMRKPQKIECQNCKKGKKVDAQHMYFRTRIESSYTELDYSLQSRLVEEFYYTDNNTWVFKFTKDSTTLTGNDTAVNELLGEHIEKLVVYETRKYALREVYVFATDEKRLYLHKLGQAIFDIVVQFYDITNVLTIDEKWTPLVATNDGVFKLESIKSTQEFEFRKISNVTGLVAISFSEPGEPIYATNDTIVQLKYQGCYLD